MNDTQRWYQSRTMWSGVVALIINAMREWGVDVDGDFEQQLLDAILIAMEFGAVVSAMYFRKTATKRIE